MPKNDLTNEERKRRYSVLRKLGLSRRRAINARDYSETSYRELLITLGKVNRAGYLP